MLRSVAFEELEDVNSFPEDKNAPKQFSMRIGGQLYDFCAVSRKMADLWLQTLQRATAGTLATHAERRRRSSTGGTRRRSLGDRSNRRTSAGGKSARRNRRMSSDKYTEKSRRQSTDYASNVENEAR